MIDHYIIKLANDLDRLGLVDDANAIDELIMPSKKILILIHPDCIFESAANTNINIDDYINKITQALSSGQYQEVVTELFFSAEFTTSNWFLTWPMPYQEKFLSFVKTLQTNTVCFYRHETKSGNLYQSKLYSLLEPYFNSPEYTFCFASLERYRKSELYQKIKSLIPKLVEAAQKIYDEWDQDEDGHSEDNGFGGICHLIADEFCSVLSNIPDTYISTHNPMMGENHVWAFVLNKEEGFVVDIPPHVYETGGGYTWQKIPGVTFDASDIYIDSVNPDDMLSSEELDEAFSSIDDTSEEYNS